MWHTPDGDRKLVGAEATVVKMAVTGMAEWIREESSDFGEYGEQWKYGVELFDASTWTQRIATLDQIATYLLTDTETTLELNAVSEAAVGALFEHVLVQIDLEIDLADENETIWRSPVLEAYLQVTVMDENEEEFEDFDYAPQTAQNRERNKWRNVVECLADQILWDRDFEMTTEFLDRSPEQAAYLKSFMGIEDEYYVEVAPDVPSASAIMATFERLKRLGADV